MKALYHKKSLTDKLKETFSEIFRNETAPTQKHFIDLMMSVIALNGFQSVQYNYEHFIQDVSEFKLKSYYYTLNHHFPRNTSSKSRKVVSKTIYAALGWGAKAAKNSSLCMW